MSTGTLDLLAGGGAERRWPGVRWLLLVVVAALGVAALVPVVRGRIERSAVTRLGSLWMQRGATHDALFATVAALDRAAAPQDAAAVRQAVAALQREDSARLQTLSRQAAATRTYGKVAGLRSDIVAALAVERHTLVAGWTAGEHVDPVRLEMTARQRRVDAELRALRDRLRVAPPTAGPTRLHAADAALRRLSRLLDAPLPLRLMVSGPDGAAVLDLGSNRVVPRPDVPNVTEGLVRGRYLVTANLPQVVAVPLDSGPVRVLATQGTSYAAGPAPDQVWLREPAVVALVDLTGRVLRRVATAADLRGAVRAGPVLFTGQLSVAGPAGSPPVRALAGCLGALASSAGLIVAEFCPGDASPGAVRVIDVGSGSDSLLRLPPGEYHVRSASVSPDQRQLALVLARSDGAGRLFVADAKAGTVTEVATPEVSSVGSAGVGAPDSRRLFFTSDRPTRLRSASLWTYALGDRAATAIRYVRDGQVTPLGAWAR